MKDPLFVSLWEVYINHGTKKHFSEWITPLLAELDANFTPDQFQKNHKKIIRNNTGGRPRVDYIIPERCVDFITKKHKKIKIEKWMYRTKESMDIYLTSVSFMEIKKQIDAPEAFLIEVINDIYYDEMKKTGKTAKTYQYSINSIRYIKKKILRWNIPSEVEIREKNRIARNNKKSEK